MVKERTRCCDKDKVKSGPWSYEEDIKLISFIQEHGHKNWRALPKFAGLSRCGKSCRLRWLNYLRPDVKRGNFSQEEKNTIIDLHERLGNKWSKIASRLPGRTDNEIKNVFKAYLTNKADYRHKMKTNGHGDMNTSFSSSSSIGYPRIYRPQRRSKGSENTTDGKSYVTDITGSSLDLSVYDKKGKSKMLNLDKSSTRVEIPNLGNIYFGTEKELNFSYPNIGSSSNSVETMGLENFQPDLLEVPCFPVCPNNKSLAILKEIKEDLLEGPLSLVGPEDIDSSTLIERLDLKGIIAPQLSLENEVPFFPVDTNFEEFLDLIENEMSEFKENGEHDLSIDNNVSSSSFDTKFKNTSKHNEIPNSGENLQPNLAAGNDVPFSLVGPNITSSCSQMETLNHRQNVQPVLEEVPISLIDSDNVKFSDSDEMVHYGDSMQSGLVHSNEVPSYLINSNVTDSSNPVQMLNYAANDRPSSLPRNEVPFHSSLPNVEDRSNSTHAVGLDQYEQSGLLPLNKVPYSHSTSNMESFYNRTPMLNYGENVQPGLMPQNEAQFNSINSNVSSFSTPIQRLNYGEHYGRNLFSHNQMVTHGRNQMVNYEGSIIPYLLPQNHIVNCEANVQWSLVRQSQMMNCQGNVQPRFLHQNQIPFYSTNSNVLNSPYPIQMPNFGENYEAGYSSICPINPTVTYSSTMVLNNIGGHDQYHRP